MTLADRIVILERGVIQQIGTPTEVFNRPHNLFVAGFIGSPVMNMFKGTLVAADTVALPETGAHIRLPFPIAGTAGKPVVLGIRPQGLLRSDGSDTALRMHVKVAEYLGTETVLTGTLAGSNEAVTASIDGEHGGLASKEIGLAIDPAHLHVFDATTGLNLIQR